MFLYIQLFIFVHTIHLALMQNTCVCTEPAEEPCYKQGMIYCSISHE